MLEIGFQILRCHRGDGSHVVQGVSQRSMIVQHAQVSPGRAVVCPQHRANIHTSPSGLFEQIITIIIQPNRG